MPPAGRGTAPAPQQLRGDRASIPHPTTDAPPRRDSIETPTPEAIIGTIRRWTESIVIGLDFCPFARRVFQGNRIRYVVTEAADEESLRATLAEELRHLAATPIEQVETTMLIHPRALGEFGDYCDFLPAAEQLVKSLGLRGVIQIASFHPQFQFADARPDDVENYTNRSPYPLLHLLREESISRVAGNEDDLLEIPRRNAELLRQMGRAKILEMLQGLASDRDAEATGQPDLALQHNEDASR